MKKNPDNGGVARVVPRLSSMGPGGPLRCANVGVLRRATRANPATSVVFLMTLPPVVASDSVTGVSSGQTKEANGALTRLTIRHLANRRRFHLHRVRQDDVGGVGEPVDHLDAG